MTIADIAKINIGTLFVLTHNYEFATTSFLFGPDLALEESLDKQDILKQFVDVVFPNTEYNFAFTKHDKQEEGDFSRVYFLPCEFPRLSDKDSSLAPFFKDLVSPDCANLIGEYVEDVRIAPAALLCPFEGALKAFMQANHCDDSFLVDLIFSRAQNLACFCVLKDKILRDDNLLTLYSYHFDFTNDSPVDAMRKVCAHGTFILPDNEERSQRLCAALATRYCLLRASLLGQDLPTKQVVADSMHLFSAICFLVNAEEGFVSTLITGLMAFLLSKRHLGDPFLNSVIPELRANPLRTLGCRQPEGQTRGSPALPLLISPALFKRTLHWVLVAMAMLVLALGLMVENWMICLAVVVMICWKAILSLVLHAVLYAVLFVVMLPVMLVMALAPKLLGCLRVACRRIF